MEARIAFTHENVAGIFRSRPGSRDHAEHFIAARIADGQVVRNFDSVSEQELGICVAQGQVARSECVAFRGDEGEVTGVRVADLDIARQGCRVVRCDGDRAAIDIGSEAQDPG